MKIFENYIKNSVVVKNLEDRLAILGQENERLKLQIDSLLESLAKQSQQSPKKVWDSSLSDFSVQVFDAKKIAGRKTPS